MIEKFSVHKTPDGPVIVGNKFRVDVTFSDEAKTFVDWINARLTELNLDVQGMDPSDPLNVAYTDAIQRAQGGAHDGLPKRLRYYVMQQVAAQAIRNHPFADIVECGCWHGHSTLLIERTMLRHGTHDSHLHVFDSFEGLSEFKPQDHSPLLPTIDAQRVRGEFRSDHDTLRAKLSDRTHLYKGWIPDVLYRDAPHPLVVSFINLDLDLYEPTRDALTYLYPSLVRGGAIFFDDYGFRIFPGVTAAVDEFVATRPQDLFVKLPTGGAYLVKS